MAYVPQLTIPSQDDPYYIRKAYGGYSPCVQGKPEWFTGSALANCVGYCWGRSAYLEQNPNCNIGFSNISKIMCVFGTEQVFLSRKKIWANCMKNFCFGCLELCFINKAKPNINPNLPNCTG